MTPICKHYCYGNCTLQAMSLGNGYMSIACDKTTRSGYPKLSAMAQCQLYQPKEIATKRERHPSENLKRIVNGIDEARLQRTREEMEHEE